ncbi:MAG: S46 family peptidase [Kofleriaceae bacterium]
MKRTNALCGLLLAAACGGSGKKSTPTTVATGERPDATDVAGDPPQAVVDDPTAAARHAFANPGGMWMPRQMKHPTHAAALTAMGVSIPAADLANPLAAPLNAVVSLGGCTASFVSPQGLVVTNHHCVQGALQFNATPEHNYVEDGFLAKTMGEELPAGPTQKVFVAQAFTDITDAITKDLGTIKDPAAREHEVENRTKQQLAACEKDRPGIRCDVKSFYRGAEYQLIEYLEIRDVRLVYVPARSIGNYGGEIDNWAWPRHTGDWSFYRAYVGKDGKPADFAADNVPYQPKHWLKVSQAGLAQDDFVMVTGYPGRTSRVTTYGEVDHDVQWRYPTLIKYLQDRYDLLEALLKSDAPDATKIKATGAKQSVQNGLEKYQGVLAGLQKGDMLARKKATDDQVKAWAAQPGNETYQAAIDSLEALLAADRKTAAADFNFGNAMGGSAHLRNALLFVRLAEERTKPDAARKPGFQDRDLPRLVAGQKQFARQYDATIDRMFFKLVLTNAADLPAADRPWLSTLLGTKKGAKIDAKVIEARLDGLYKGTKLVDEATRLDLLNNATPKSLKASKDPFIKLAVAVWPMIKAQEAKDDADEGKMMMVAPMYAKAMIAALGGFVAPDANSTLRITYGTIKPFASGGLPFTKATEILAKDKGEEPFDAPAKLLAAIKAKNFGPYADKNLGDLPVDFIADLDITGGNSGSPVLNRKGELVGLAFDGNIEGVASDVVFNYETTRTIMVDARYMMWVMDAIEGADNVLTELGVHPSL